MIELSPEIIAAMMMGGVLVGVLTGVPLGAILGILAVVFGYVIWGDKVPDLLYMRIVGVFKIYVILACPLFIFMGSILERSGITERLYDALHLWLGAFRGGLAIATILIGTILAACLGVVAASVTMLSIIAVPSMLRRGYSKSLASASACAGGCLGILIPPSVMLVIYGPMAQLSVGKLFFGAFVPGFVLSGLYCSYIALRCLLQPKMAPVVAPEERQIPFIKKTSVLFFALVPTALLILGVLGTIFFGIAPPTEAAGVGALLAVFLALGYRKLSWRGLKEAGLETVKLCGLIFFLFPMAVSFTSVFIGAGGAKVVEGIILATPGGRWGAFAVIMFISFILGFFIDWIGIILIMVPIVTPIAQTLGFDPLWFAIMICVNLQTSFMTPPFAGAIFIARGTIPPEFGVTMNDIIRGVIPFVICILIALGLLVAFPELVLWLPGMMIE